MAKSAHARALVEKHFAVFRKLFENMTRISAAVVAKGGFVAIEWPRFCAYWQEPEVQQFVNQHGLQSVYFDGCMFGLVSRFGQSAGIPIRKPWRVDTNSPALLQSLDRCCNHKHDHTPCAGSDTRATEGYTDELVATIHEAFAAQCQLRQVRGGVCAWA